MEGKWGRGWALLALVGVAAAGKIVGGAGVRTGPPKAIVLWHGMGDNCCDPISMGHIKRLLEQNVPGSFVYSIEVGASIKDDTMNGFLMPASVQVEYVCNVLNNVTELRDGFNAIGFSQGGQFLRGLVQQCATANVFNLISVGGQHQGVFGLPKCPGVSRSTCDAIRRTLDLGAYTEEAQAKITQAGYWHDPLQESLYATKSEFLGVINNERNPKNATFSVRLNALNKFVMVKFLNDTVVQPIESEWFGFYDDGQDKTVHTLMNSTLYTEDWIGLAKMVQNHKIDFLSVIGDHLKFTDEWFIDNIVKPYLI